MYNDNEKIKLQFFYKEIIIHIIRAADRTLHARATE